MKKIIILLVAALLGQSVLFAQSGTSVKENDVPERYVKDLHRLAGDVKNVEWLLVDTMVYDALYTSDNGTRTAYRFSPKGSETRWYVEEKYYPRAIKEKIQELHPGHKVKELYALMVKNKVTYQVLVGKRKGLFVKRWKSMRLMNFEVDGKFIDEVEL